MRGVETIRIVHAGRPDEPIIARAWRAFANSEPAPAFLRITIQLGRASFPPTSLPSEPRCQPCGRLIAATKDDPAQAQLLKATQILAAQRLAVRDEVLRLQGAGDTAGLGALRARAEGRAAMATIVTNFDRLAAEEERLLA